ncbi:hypothetical protein KEM56_002713 [Ascosphaera pollenicola]|nr:hypothetical protein KEM56_002713 [Ascosphaera pollenicola]
MQAQASKEVILKVLTEQLPNLNGSQKSLLDDSIVCQRDMSHLSVTAQGWNRLCDEALTQLKIHLWKEFTEEFGKTLWDAVKVEREKELKFNWSAYVRPSIVLERERLLGNFEHALELRLKTFVQEGWKSPRLPKWQRNYNEWATMGFPLSILLEKKQECDEA